MSKIDELIQELCPDGVEYKELGLVCKFQRGNSITFKDVTDGYVPVIAGGQKPSYYHNIPNRTGETIAVSGSGAYAGFVTYWNIPVFLSDSFSVSPDIEILMTKYVFYYLKRNQEKIHDTKKGGGVPHVHGSSISKFLIPIPPLPIQQEIVNILDKFTSLEARKKQYEYYRNELLNFEGKEVEWKTLGEVIKLQRGKRLVKSQLEESGSYAVFQNCLTPLGYYHEYNVNADTTFIISAGAAGEIGYSDVDFWAADDVYFLITPKEFRSKFIYYFLLTNQNKILSQVRRASIPRLSRNGIEKLQIPIPTIEEQKRIVNILDKFDALVNDISTGLPAEITARRKQYEYYRGKLLDFKTKGTNN